MVTTEAPDRPASDFDDFYARWRGPIYRALVLVLDDRDRAVEAADRAFGKAYRRRRKLRAAPHPEAMVFAAAYGWATKSRSDGPDIHGFRLERAELDTDQARALDALRSLPVADRAVLVLRHLLEWDDARIAAALGLGMNGAAARLTQAAVRLAERLGTTPEEAQALLGPATRRFADGLIEPLQRPEAVRSQAWIDRLKTAGIAALIVLVVGGVVLGATRTLQRGPDEVVALDPITGLPVTPGAASASATSVVDAAAIQWAEIPVPIQEGEASALAYGPGGFVALANDYSGGRPTWLALHSEDGFEWENAPLIVFDGDGWIQQLTGGDFGYLAIGQTFEERTGRDQAITIFSEDGEEWIVTPLQVGEDIVEFDGIQFGTSTYVSQVLHTGAEFILVANQSINFDRDPMDLLRDRLPEDVDLNAANGWGFDDRGLQIYDNFGNVKQSFTWEELGLGEEFAMLMGGGRPIVLRSSDGVTWEPDASRLGFLGARAWLGGLAVSGDVMVAQVHGDFGPYAVVSTDGGLTWDDLEVPGSTVVNAVAQFDGRIVVAGQNELGEAAVWTSTDGLAWVPASTLGSGVVQRLVTSPAGLVAQIDLTAGALQPVELEVEGTRVELTPAGGGFRILDADGNVVAEFGSGNVEYDREEQLVNLIDDDGNVVLSIPQRQVDQAMQEFYMQQDRGFADGPRMDLAVSRDGERWTVVGMTEVAGPGFYPNGIALGPEALVVTGWRDGGGFFEGPPQVSFLVADLTGSS